MVRQYVYKRLDRREGVLTLEDFLVPCVLGRLGQTTHSLTWVGRRQVKTSEKSEITNQVLFLHLKYSL